MFQSFQNSKATVFRLNPLLAPPQKSLEELSSFHPSPIEGLEHAYWVAPEHHRALTQSAAFMEGRIYLQSPSSMLAAYFLEPRPHERILDLAAAPGGKAALMAALMNNQGEIACVEPGKERFFRMKRNLEQQGISIARFFLKDGRFVGKATGAVFDRVMLDAPCSSESRFSEHDPKSTAYWSERKIKEMSRLQKSLILSAFSALKPGGVMVYATCSFAPEENEAVVHHLLQKHQAVLAPCALFKKEALQGMDAWKGKSFDPQLRHAVRILPDALWDGFFMCKIIKPDPKE